MDQEVRRKAVLVMAVAVFIVGVIGVGVASRVFGRAKGASQKITSDAVPQPTVVVETIPSGPAETGQEQIKQNPAGNDPYAQWAEYKQENNEYSIKYPKGLSMEMTDFQVKIWGEENGEPVYVSIQLLDTGGVIASEFGQQKREETLRVRGNRRVGVYRGTQVGGNSGYEFTVDTASQSLTYYYLIKSNDSVLEIITATPQDIAPEQKMLTKQILSTLEINK